MQVSADAQTDCATGSICGHAVDLIANERAVCNRISIRRSTRQKTAAAKSGGILTALYGDANNVKREIGRGDKVYVHHAVDDSLFDDGCCGTASSYRGAGSINIKIPV